MRYCNKKLTTLQQHSLRYLGLCLIAMVALTVGVRYEFQHGHSSAVIANLFTILPALPIIFAIAIIGRYLSGENDEFVRMLVVKAMLWGLGVTMVADTILGFFIEYRSVHVPLGILNFEVFFVSAAIMLRMQLWRNR
jgi:hypothetical protein